MAEKTVHAVRPDAEHSVPGSYAAHVADVAARWNVPPSALLSEIGVTREALEDPSARVPLEAFTRLIDRACRVTAEPGFGVYLGLHSRISAHGYLGFAAMTARVLKEAIEIAVRFLPTQTSALGLRLEVRGSEASVIVEEHAPLGAARDTLVTATIVGIWRMGESITGRALVGGADFAFAEPPFASRLERLVSAPGRVLYDQPRHRLVFDAHQLDWPLLLSDAAAMRLAREQCEQELETLSRERSFASRVSPRIVDARGDARPIEVIAREVSMSIRTLKRRLAAEGVSYTSLLDERRRLRATELLGSELTIEQIADRLGYSDAANFTRAFRRWTGRTPREVRSGR